MSTEEMKDIIRNGPAPIPKEDFVGAGSYELNLACSGHTSGAIPKGTYIIIIGDTDSGKTWVANNIFAEAAHNSNFENYRLISDRPERGVRFDVAYFFGQKTADRIEPPRRDKNGEEIHSETVEELFDHLKDAFEVGKPFIYVIDSIDALTTEDDEKKEEEERKARRKDKKKKKAGSDADAAMNDEPKVSGSYGVAAAKKISRRIKRICSKLAKTGSIFIVINQTRDNIGFGAKFKPKVRAGGNALIFYARLQMWMSVKEKIKKKVKGKSRKVGTVSKVEIKRNSFTGKERTIELRIDNSVGIDRIGSSIHYLVEEGHWEGGWNREHTKFMVTAPEFDFDGEKEDLAQLIIEKDREKDLRWLVGHVWKGIEKACQLKRKRYYD